jgi:hypothetical protein
LPRSAFGVRRSAFGVRRSAFALRLRRHSRRTTIGFASSETPAKASDEIAPAYAKAMPRAMAVKVPMRAVFESRWSMRLGLCGEGRRKRS